MKITRETEVNNEPLLGAKIIFTKHSERNKKSYVFEEKYRQVSFDKAYEVVGYSHWPKQGRGPQVVCDNGEIGDVPMSSADYDIVSMPEKSKFTPITIVLETEEDLWNLYRSNFDDELQELLKELK